MAKKKKKDLSDATVNSILFKGDKEAERIKDVLCDVIKTLEKNKISHFFIAAKECNAGTIVEKSIDMLLPSEAWPIGEETHKEYHREPFQALLKILRDGGLIGET